MVSRHFNRHGVSLLSGGSGRLNTRLDTPPSIKCRHPDSRLARIQLRLCQRARLICNAMFRKLLARPEARVPVTRHLENAVALEQLGQFADDTLRRERRLDLPEAIDFDHIAIDVTHGASE